MVCEVRCAVKPPAASTGGRDELDCRGGRDDGLERDLMPMQPPVRTGHRPGAYGTGTRHVHGVPSPWLERW
jgi:hypothetical protein